MNVNERLQDRTITHSLRILRLSNREAQEIVRFLQNDVVPDLVEKIGGMLSRIELSGGSIRGVEAQRLQALSRSVDEMLEVLTGGKGSGSVQARILKQMEDLAQVEAQWMNKTLKDVVPIQINTALPSVGLLRSLVANQPFDGAPLSQWFSNISSSTRDQIMRQIRIGMVEGEGVDQIVRRLRGTYASGYTDGILSKGMIRHSEAIARSAIIHSSSMAKQAYFEQNSDLIKSMQWNATLDTRTCEQCMGLDGSTHPIDGGPRPPVHIQCRCVMVPVVKSWRELGIDMDEIPEGTRASMGGQVPESTTYPQWLQRQTPAIQKEALGAGKYKLWKEGRVKIGDFVNEQGQILSLDQLRKISGVPETTATTAAQEFDVPKWTPAKSKPEAAEYTQSLGFSEADWKGLPLEAINEFNKSMAWAARQLGMVRGDVAMRTRSIDPYGRFSQRYTRLRGSGDIEVRKELTISTLKQKVGDYERILKAQRDYDMSTGWTYKGNSSYGTGAHEMVHYYTSLLYDARYGTTFNLQTVGTRRTAWKSANLIEEVIENALDSIGKTWQYVDDEIYPLLGEYSKTNPHELLAVAIQYEYDNPGQLPFAAELIKQLRKALYGNS